MKKSIYFLVPLIALLTVSACSRLPEKEVVTVPTILETPNIDAPTIRIVRRPQPVELKNADIIVVTEANLQEVIDRVINTQGEFVLYAMTASSFEALALNFEQIKRFIEEQEQIVLYYEKSVQPSIIEEKDLD